eukprot:11421383-Ditylum_brightwellii.AAC.1
MKRYKIAYRLWLELPAPNRTYQNLTVHFDCEYQLQNTIKSSRQAGYHQLNNMEEFYNTEQDATLEET